MNDEETEPGFPQELLEDLRDPQFDFVAQQLRASLRRTVLGRESPPAHAGRFVVLRSIGRGAMGLVYEAYDPDLDRKVAIKVLRARGATARAALLREGRALARLSHPAIVTVFEVGTLPESPEPSVFVAMELVSGGSLRRWLDSSVRPWREIVAVFVAIGEALAAAHGDGVVHGDFKPDNVLLDARGRPKVVDFGLARIRRAPPPTLDEQVSRDAAPLLTGPFGGTPAYAAPEIADGTGPDARADQYSFCMALFEALWGARARRDADGTLVLPPLRAPRVVPEWLRAVVLTGLELDPHRRHETMTVLVERLRRESHHRRRRRWALGLAAVGLVAIGASASRLSGSATPECPDPEPMLAQTWNPARREALRERLLESELPFATELADRLLQHVDAHVESWRAQLLDACQATHVQHLQSQDVLDRRYACLERDRRDLDITLEVVAERGGAALMHAFDAVQGLPSPTSCAEVGTLDRVPSVEERETIEAIGDHLGRAHAYDRAGAEPELSMIEARAAWELARGLDDPRQHTRTGAAVGRAFDRAGDYPAARAAGEEALWLAYREGDHEGIVRAATLLGWVIGFRMSDSNVASVYLEMGEASASKTEILARMRADLAEVAAASASTGGDYEQALAYFESALALRRATGDLQDEARCLENMSEVNTVVGHAEVAREQLERAAEIWARTLPADHPATLHNEFLRGEQLIQVGEYAEGLRHAEHAYARWIRVYPPNHHESVILLRDLGRLASRAGDVPSARKHLAAALPLLVAAQEHHQIALTHALLGELELKQGDFAAARVQLEQALRVWKSAMPEAHPFAVETEINLCKVGLGQHDLPRARVHFERAEELVEQLPSNIEEFRTKLVELRSQLDAAG